MLAGDSSQMDDAPRMVIARGGNAFRRMFAANANMDNPNWTLGIAKAGLIKSKINE